MTPAAGSAHLGARAVGSANMRELVAWLISGSIDSLAAGRLFGAV